MQQKKSQAYYRFLQDMATGKLSYFEAEEIEDAAYDLIDNGNLDDAFTLVEHGLKLHPNNEDLELIMIWLLMRTQRVDEAENLFAKYKDQDDDAVLRLKFQFEVHHGHHHEALSHFLPQLKRGKVHPIDWLQTINEMFDEFSPETLSPYLIMAMDFMPEEAEAWGQLGGLLMDLRQLQQAIKCLEHSIDIDAYNIYSWQDLCRCYINIADFDKCAEACEYGLAIEPKNPVFSFFLGVVYHSRQKFKEAIPLFEVSRQYAEGKLKVDYNTGSDINMREQADDTYELLGYCYERAEQQEKAIECYEIHFERNPKNVVNACNLAMNYLRIGDTANALRVTKRAIEINSAKTELMTLQVTILASMHRYDETMECLDLIIAKKPRSYVYRLAKAVLCSSIGKNEEADKTYREILAMNPKNKDVRQALIDYFSTIEDFESLKKLKKE